MPAIEKTKDVADFLHWIAAPEFCLESGKIVNTTADAMTLKGLPMPVKVNTAGGDNGTTYEVVLAADEANATGFIIHKDNETIEAGETSKAKYAVLARGSATVSKEAIPTADPAGDAYDVAALVAVLEAMSPIVIVRDASSNLQLTKYVA